MMSTIQGPPRMVVVVPSRNRPKSIVELAECFKIADSAELWVCVDSDDDDLPEYKELAGQGVCDQLWISQPKRIGPWLNHVAGDVDAPIVGFMGDDHRPRTPGWDSQIADALATPGIAYGNDLLQGRNLPTAAFISREIIDALGYMVPPGLQHMYIDNAWKTLGELGKCLRYLPDVIIEHMHPIARKGEWDDSYRASNSGEMYANDERAYLHWLDNQASLDGAKIRGL